ncbi:hypothetical protein CPB84DRAFT_1750867 [Gymnopilus junonius]|uniref:Uncharacterized protein n=1 Tax=Gymnopilus junonius TaxID=109634 RepID=A0A9P5TIT2_GYMJU|nr:hypothetical protein CPB84DRAFT_1750867 [Gymnopilus junonius]
MYNEIYDSINPDIDSYQLHISLIYTNATHTESAVKVTLHILYFVGVYYTVLSPAVSVFHNLQSQAYSPAALLPLVTLPSVTNNVDLDQALYEYNMPNFYTKWNYLYDSDEKPTDFATNESQPIFSKNQDLAYFNTCSLTNYQVDAYVQLHIMEYIMTSKFPNILPKIIYFLLDAAKVIDAVKGAISAHFLDILGIQDLGRWKYNVLDKTFGIGLATWRPIRINVLITYYSSSKKILVEGKEVTVDMIYLYFFGVIYELQTSPIVQDM